jgi:hypothetical protein
MTPSAPRKRATIMGGPEGLEIVIPAQRNPITLVFLGVWLIGWAMGERNVLAEFLADRASSPGPLLLFWLLVWTIGGALAFTVWLWVLVGKERILMGASTLRIKRDILGFGVPRTYDLRKIRNLRVDIQPITSANRDVVLRLSGLAAGSIAFECEGKAICFGLSLSDTEARTIVDRMRQRYAFPETPAMSMHSG